MVDILAKGTTITGIYHALLLQKLKKMHQNWDAWYTDQRWFDSCRTIFQLTTLIMPKQKFGTFLTLLTLPTLHFSNHEIFKGKRLSNDESLVSKVNTWLQAQPAEFYGLEVYIAASNDWRSIQPLKKPL